MDRIFVSKDKKDIDLEKVVRYLLEDSYWGKERDRDLIKKSIDNSICYSVILDGGFIGFGRVITDFSTFKFLCDVFILPEYHGRGYGRKLMEYIMDDPELKEGSFLLLTRNAHKLYRKFGFRQLSDNRELVNRFMFIRDPRKERPV